MYKLKLLACFVTAAALSSAAVAGAADKPDGDGSGKEKAEAPRAEQSVTQHSVAIGGKTIDYTATAGRLILRDDKDEPTAAVGFVAYTQRNAGDPAKRPITFAYNGGPGSSSIWLHELKFGQGKTYNVRNAEIFGAWDWKHKAPGPGFAIPFPNTGLDLAHALGYNPNLRVLVLNGLYDLATPFMATESMIDHLGLEKDLRSHVQMKYYDAGHMMYIHEPALQQMKADVATFFDATSHP